MYILTTIFILMKNNLFLNKHSSQNSSSGSTYNNRHKLIIAVLYKYTYYREKKNIYIPYGKYLISFILECTPFKLYII